MSQAIAKDLFERAINYHLQGDIVNAEKEYRAALDSGFSSSVLVSNLGIICQATQRTDEAILLFKKAIRMNPNHPDAYNNLGGLYKSLGNYDQALALILKSLELNPHHSNAHMNLGGVYHDLGKLDQALIFTLKSLDFSPDNSTAYMNLGVIHQDLGNLDEALGATLKSLELDPDNSNAHMNLGSIYKDTGNLEQALASTLKSLKLNSNNSIAYMNLGTIYKDIGNLTQALCATHKSLKLVPHNPIALLNLGCIYKDLGNLDEALGATLKSLDLKPDNSNAHMNLAKIYKDLGKLEQARTALHKASKLDPTDLEKALAEKLFFSDLYEDIEHIDRERSLYGEGIEEISKKLSIYKNTSTSCSTHMFWMAYHNKNDDREILEKLGKLLQSAYNSNVKHESLLSKTTSEAEILNIGICSDFLHYHTIGKLYSGIIRSLKEKGFHLTILRGPGSKIDKTSIFIDSLADVSIRLPQSLPVAHEIVRQQKIDFLLYPEIGMSPYIYMLALERLAPIQAVSWGHPNTTGLNTVDYFISSDLIETLDAQTKYTEQLIKLTKLPCVYELPQTEGIRSDPGKFSLPLNNCLVGIPQSLFKFHPDYDIVLEQIIQKLPNIRYVLIEGNNKTQMDRLKARWHRNAPTTLQNTFFLPRMSKDDYLCLLDTVDLLLDPIYFGSGNTFYESMALGTPIVTMPGDLMRGRIVAGGYKQMRLENAPIADNIQEYIELTVRLAENAELRKKMKIDIKSAANRYLFNDLEVAEEIFNFIHEAIDVFRSKGGLLPVDWKPSSLYSL